MTAVRNPNGASGRHARDEIGDSFDSQEKPVPVSSTSATSRQGQLDAVIRYYDGCSRADAALMLSTLHPDVVHYFLAPNRGSRPVAGATRLADYWRKVQQLIDAHWIVDRFVGDGTEAVVEWSMFWRDTPDGERLVTRGAEWYVFENGLIREIRSYHQQPTIDTGLDAFPYEDRAYAVHGRERSALHAGARGAGS